MHTVRLLFAVILLAPVLAIAEDVRLYVMHVKNTQLRVVLPVRVGETPAEAARKYVDSVNKVEDLRNSMNGGTLSLPPSDYYPLEPALRSETQRPHFAILANEFEQIQPGHFYMEKATSAYGNAGANVYVIPPTADLRLAHDEKNLYRGRVARAFDSMVALGGADVDPALYNDSIRYSRNFHPVRDASEVEMIRTFIKTQHGIFYGICRGHQICSVSQGHAMIQDIQAETMARGHQNGWHQIDLTADPDSHLRSFLPGRDKVWVNTLHHQSVLPRAGTSIKPIAWQNDGTSIVEAMQFRNGLGLTMQFHPEAMDNDEGRAIMSGMVELAAKARGRRVKGCIISLLGNSVR